MKFTYFGRLEFLISTFVMETGELPDTIRTDCVEWSPISVVCLL